MTYSWRISCLSEIGPVISCLEDLSKQYKVFLFIGELGLGKTTLIKKWMGSKGVKDDITSPSYSIINEYLNKGATIYHMDCYRLNSVKEALEIGMEEYLDSGDLCLIEWPQVMMELLATAYITVTINKGEGAERIYTIQTFDIPSIVDR